MRNKALHLHKATGKINLSLLLNKTLELKKILNWIYSVISLWI
jgi:hypothetical protein